MKLKVLKIEREKNQLGVRMAYCEWVYLMTQSLVLVVQFQSFLGTALIRFRLNDQGL